MLISNATLADGRVTDIRIDGEQIAEIGADLTAVDGEETIDATGNHLLPGMIDVHVHFRQPGYGHKETWETGSKSAAAGGVTTVVDQPNTEPPTINREAFEEKAKLAAESVIDFGINGGVTADWDPESLFSCPLFALGEVFLADSTGEMGIETELFADALAEATSHNVPVTVHAEDATLFDESAKERDDADAWSAFRAATAEAEAVKLACELAQEQNATIHIAHTSTPEAVEIAAETGMTCEVTPHHLFLSRDDLAELGTHGRMNPPLRSESRREKLFEHVANGTVDMIATDHAPHTLAEKDAGIWEAPSGVPGVETVLPLLLAEVNQDKLTLERVVELTAANPASVFGLERKGTIVEGNDADLVLVDLDQTEAIDATSLHTNCEWTPFEGWDAVFPKLTILRGKVAYNRETDEFGGARGTNVCK